MAAPQQIQAALETLKNAFPEKTHSKATLELYYRHLADIPPRALERAVVELVRSSHWFPRIAELRQAAFRFTGTVNGFESLPRFSDQLAARVLQLEQAYYQSGTLEVGEWESLAAQFERQGREHRAAHTRLKLERFTANLTFDQSGSEVEAVREVSAAA